MVQLLLYVSNLRGGTRPDHPEKLISATKGSGMNPEKTVHHKGHEGHKENPRVTLFQCFTLGVKHCAGEVSVFTLVSFVSFVVKISFQI